VLNVPHKTSSTYEQSIPCPRRYVHHRQPRVCTVGVAHTCEIPYAHWVVRVSYVYLQLTSGAPKSKTYPTPDVHWTAFSFFKHLGRLLRSHYSVTDNNGVSNSRRRNCPHTLQTAQNVHHCEKLSRAARPNTRANRRRMAAASSLAHEDDRVWAITRRCFKQGLLALFILAFHSAFFH